MGDPIETEAKTIASLAIAGMGVEMLGDHPFLLRPNGYTVEDFEQFLPEPLRVKAIVSLATIAGFIAYVEKFKENQTAIFAHPDTGKVSAILDYHGPSEGDVNGARWCSHKAHFAPAYTIEWQRWLKSDHQWMEQRPFAEFIENNVDDIVNPAGATMLEIAATLEAKTAVEFKSGVRLDNGTQRLMFASETSAKAGEKGTLDIPLAFELALTPFVGGEAYPLVARFRYKIHEGKLTLRYQLVNPHKVLESAIEATVETIATGTGIQPFIGTAP